MESSFGKLKRKLHSFYRGFVPPVWRARARWVWGISFASAILWSQFTSGAEGLRVYFYDVGQGDAIHVRTAQGFDVVIDGGPTSRIVEKLGRTLPFWDKDIELMILTHPHADHAVGLIEVLRRFKVERVLATGVLHTTDEYLAWLKEIKMQGVPVEIARVGKVYELKGEGSGGNLPLLEILHPEDNFEGRRVAEGKIGEGGGLNDTSIVAKLTYGKTAFLFMGDATSKVEKELVHSLQFGVDSNDNATNYELSTINSRLRADVLKVGHHGSKYSTSREFLKSVRPKYAVIQVGKNRYGHPAYAALYRLKQAGVEVLRNDQDGDVVFESDGLAIKKIP